MTRDYRSILPDGATDIFANVPTSDRVALEIRSWGSDAGYRAMFGDRWSSLLDLPREAIDSVVALPAQDYLERARQILGAHLPDAAASAQRLRSAGIARAVIHAPLPTDIAYPLEATAELAAQDPELFVPFARINPDDPRKAAAAIQRGATELGMRGITLSPFWHGISVDDPEMAPIFETADKLGLIVWTHMSHNWTPHRPLELEHPRHVDALAGRHPNLRIVCGHGGWPWLTEAVAVAWRHPNVYLDISAFRPKHVFTPGSGWDPLVYYGSRTLRTKILFGSTWTLLGMTPEEVYNEAANVPWSESVIEAWLSSNGRRLLQEVGA